MPAEEFSIDRVKEVRQAAQRAATLPAVEAEGWMKSPIDPMAVLAVFKSLSLRSGYTLRAYIYHHGGNGKGVVWAMPVDAEFPEPHQCDRIEGRSLDQPKPVSALADFRSVLEGDRSAWSFLSASILTRELWEFGSAWHEQDWSTHHLLGQDPISGDAPLVDESGAWKPDQWTWKQESPASWSAVVIMDEMDVEVQFLTFSELGMQRIYLHTDRYTASSYAFDREETVVAQGGAGYIF